MEFYKEKTTDRIEQFRPTDAKEKLPIFKDVPGGSMEELKEADASASEEKISSALKMIEKSAVCAKEIDRPIPADQYKQGMANSKQEKPENKVMQAIKNGIKHSKEGAANYVYTLMGSSCINWLPGFIKNNIPVYRSSHLQYAGKPNKQGISEWHIGNGGKAKATEWLLNHMEDKEAYGVIRSTLGELQNAGEFEMRDYGLGNKLVLKQTQKLGQYEIVRSNKG